MRRLNNMNKTRESRKCFKIKSGDLQCFELEIYGLRNLPNLSMKKSKGEMCLIFLRFLRIVQGVDTLGEYLFSVETQEITDGNA